jgi:hypothetical protein
VANRGACRSGHGSKEPELQYQSDYILRIIEQMGSLIRRALERFREGGDPEESLELTEQAVGLAVDMDPSLFLRLDPPSMASFLQIGSTDDRQISQLAEALEVQAEILEESGALVAAQARREQVRALRGLLGPGTEN